MAVKLYGPEEITLGVTQVGPGHERADVQVAGIFTALRQISLAGAEMSLACLHFQLNIQYVTMHDKKVNVFLICNTLVIIH